MHFMNRVNKKVVLNYNNYYYIIDTIDNKYGSA